MIMKISELDIVISEDYNNFAEKLIQEIDERFFRMGYNSLSMSNFISYLRKEFYLYASLKFDKKINVKIILPSIPKRLIEKSIYNNKEEIILRISPEKIIGMLKGTNSSYEDDIYDLVNQFNIYMTQNKDEDFRKYLLTQMISLSSICANDLLLYFSKDVIKRNLVKPDGWKRLSKKSSIFNDYYTFFLENKESNSKIFTKFLKMVAKDIDN